MVDRDDRLAGVGGMSSRYTILHKPASWAGHPDKLSSINPPFRPSYRAASASAMTGVERAARPRA
jgi:hypothetical protein